MHQKSRSTNLQPNHQSHQINMAEQVAYPKSTRNPSQNNGSKSRNNSHDMIPADQRMPQKVFKQQQYQQQQQQEQQQQQSHQSYQRFQQPSSANFRENQNYGGMLSTPLTYEEINQGYEQLENYQRNDPSNKQALHHHHGGSKSLDQQLFKRMGSVPSNNHTPTPQLNSSTRQKSSLGAPYLKNASSSSLSNNSFAVSNQALSSSNNPRTTKDSRSILSMKTATTAATGSLSCSSKSSSAMNVQQFLNSNKPTTQYNQAVTAPAAVAAPVEFESFRKADLSEFLSFRTGDPQKLSDNSQVKDNRQQSSEINQNHHHTNDNNNYNNYPLQSGIQDESMLCPKNPFVSYCSVPKDLSQSKNAGELGASNSYWKWKPQLWQQQQQQQQSTQNGLCDISSFINCSMNHRDTSVLKTHNTSDISMMRQIPTNPQDISIIKQPNAQDISIIRPSNVQDTSCFSREDQSILFLENNQNSKEDSSINMQEPSTFFKRSTPCNRNSNSSNNSNNIGNNNNNKYVAFSDNNVHPNNKKNKEAHHPQQTNQGKQQQQHQQQQQQLFLLENLSKDLSINCSAVEEISLVLEQKKDRVQKTDETYAHYNQNNNLNGHNNNNLLNVQDLSDNTYLEEPSQLSIDAKLQKLLRKMSILEEDNTLLRKQLEKAEEFHELKVKDFTNRISTLQADKIDIQTALTAKIEALTTNLQHYKKGYEERGIKLNLLAEKKTNIQSKQTEQQSRGSKEQQSSLAQSKENNNNLVNLNHPTTGGANATTHNVLISEIMAELKVSKETDIMKHLRQIGDKDVPKLLDCLRDMIVNFAPEGCFETKPSIKQIWKWLKKVLKEYMSLKQTETLSLAFKEQAEQAYKYVHAAGQQEFLPKLSQLVVDNEGYFKIVQLIKAYFNLNQPQWNNLFELECFFEAINQEKSAQNNDLQDASEDNQSQATQAQSSSQRQNEKNVKAENIMNQSGCIDAIQNHSN